MITLPMPAVSIRTQVVLWFSVFALCTSPTSSSADPLLTPQGVQIYWIDSEGGGSTLIVTPSRESILLDSGNPGGRDSSRILHVLTNVAGLKRLDYLITTHLHIDHFGGAAEIAAQIPVGTLLDNGLPERDPDGNKSDTRWTLMSRPYREMKVGNRVVVQPGTHLAFKGSEGFPSTSLTCVATRKQFLTPSAGTGTTNAACAQNTTKPVDTSDNANSSVWLLQFGPFRFLDGGDLTWNIEAQLVCPTNRIGTVDVFQVNHHGLDVSNNPLLVHSIAPTIAVMNNGPRKGMAAEVMNTLRTSPGLQQIFALHKNVRNDFQGNPPEECMANLDEKCAAHFIQLATSPQGTDYRVTIPATGRSWSFNSRAHTRR